MLGYLNHGNPVPWDEDIDIIIDMDRMDELCSIVGKYANHSGLLRCNTFVTEAHFNSKIYFEFASSIKGRLYKYPYLDVFGFNIIRKEKNGVPYEIFYETLRGEPWWNIPAQNIFPVSWRFFGGDLFPFARSLSKVFLDKFVSNRGRYDSDRCRIGTWDHRKEVERPGKEFECCQLMEIFHFKKTFCLGKDTFLEIVMIGGKTIYLVLSSATANPIVFYRENFNSSEFRELIGLYSVVRNTDLKNLLCYSNTFVPPKRRSKLAGASLHHSNFSTAVTDVKLGGHVIAFPDKLRSMWKGDSSLIFGAVFCGEYHIVE
jgi:hypothetical protein